MNRKYIFLNRWVIMIITIAVMATNSSCLRDRASQVHAQTGNAQSLRSFVLPGIPTILVDPGERAEYLALHYWDHFDFADTTLVQSVQEPVAEQAFADYIDLLTYVPSGKVGLSLKRFLKKAEASNMVYDYFAGLSEKYLYDPNSPFRNEEWYITMLEEMLSSACTDDIEKQILQYRLRQTCKNRIETIASDFALTFASGEQGRVHRIPADYLIVYFYNPGCHACAEMQSQLETSSVITDILKDRRLRILAVYTDEDLDIWRNYQKRLPSLWLNTYASQAVSDSLYDLRVMPTTYLLDASKKVLLKDATVQQLEEALVRVKNPEL